MANRSPIPDTLRHCCMEVVFVLLPRVGGVGPGVEASGFQVDPFSDRLMSIQPVDLVMTRVPSPWGSLMLASAIKVPHLAVVVSPDCDLVWVVRAPLPVVVDRLRAQDIPDDWAPPLAHRRLGSGQATAEVPHAV